MIHLKTYEAFDIDNFKTFIDKYRKSGGYVSKTDIKRLDDSDIKYDNFKIIEDGVDRCLEFFRNNDFELLEDILLDLYDECPYLDRDKTIKYFSLKCNARNFGGWYSGTEFDIDAGKFQSDSNGLPNKYLGYELSDRVDLIDSIFSKADSKLKNEIAEEREKMKKDESGRPGKDSYSVIKLRSLLKAKTPFKKMAITPNIIINFATVQSDDYQHYDYEEEQTIRSENNEKNNKIKSLLDQSISRYLSAIGYPGSKTYIKSDYSWYTFLMPNFKIEVSKQNGLF